jgi:hypothetical protein
MLMSQTKGCTLLWPVAVLKENLQQAQNVQ